MIAKLLFHGQLFWQRQAPRAELLALDVELALKRMRLHNALGFDECRATILACDGTDVLENEGYKLEVTHERNNSNHVTQTPEVDCTHGKRHGCTTGIFRS